MAKILETNLCRINYSESLEEISNATDNNLITNFFIKNDELLKNTLEKQSKTL